MADAGVVMHYWNLLYSARIQNDDTEQHRTLRNGPELQYSTVDS